MSVKMKMARFVARRVAINVTRFKFAQRALCSNAGAELPGSNRDQIVKEPLNKHEVIDNSKQYDIAIVGGGMVGMALACSLASTPLTRHLNVAIIDSNPALQNADLLKKEGPPDPRVSTVTPATISFYRDMGAWQHVQQHRHAFFDKMQVWDYTGLGYTRYSARDVGKEVLGCVVENKVLHGSLLSSIQTR